MSESAVLPESARVNILTGVMMLMAPEAIAVGGGLLALTPPGWLVLGGVVVYSGSRALDVWANKQSSGLTDVQVGRMATGNGNVRLEKCRPLYEQCYEEKWGGPWRCNECYTYCMAQNEWPFDNCAKNLPKNPRNFPGMR